MMFQKNKDDDHGTTWGKKSVSGLRQQLFDRNVVS